MFFAVLIPKPLQAAAEVIQRALRRANADVKWVEPANLHFTIKFLGETSPELLPGLVAAGQQVAERTSRFKVSLSGLGAFPHEQWPQVVWIGCGDGSPELAQLGRDIDEALAAAQLAPLDKKPFTPHLTLGRTRSNRRIKALMQLVAQFAQVPVGPLLVNGFALMRSDLQPRGPVYTVIHEFALSRPAVSE
jgi:2'-5' RNA ligase